MDENRIALKRFVNAGKCLINYLNTMLLISQRLNTETLMMLITRLPSRQSLINVEVKEAPGNKQTPMEIASGDAL